MFNVFGMALSGNCYKLKLLLEQLQRPYEWHEVDILKGESRTPQFLEKNSNGRVPVLEIEPGVYLPESNAILCYLAEETPFWSGDKFERAQILQWLFFEQYSHEPYIAVARFIAKFLPKDHPRQATLPQLREKGEQALQVMEQHLTKQSFFVANRYSIADIALFAYTHCAADGGFELGKYPAICAWLERVRAQPGFVAMG